MKSRDHQLAVLRLTFDAPCQVSLMFITPEGMLLDVSYPQYAPAVAQFDIDDSLPEPIARNREMVAYAECVDAEAEVTHVGIRDASGRLRYIEPLPKPIRIGHLIQPEFAPGTIRITEH